MAPNKNEAVIKTNDKTLRFFESLTAGMTPRTSPGPSFKWIGRVAYLRGRAGVFKLERWSGGTHDAFVGLEGTYVSDAGAKDHIVFQFGDYLHPDIARSSNKVLAAERSVSAWLDGGQYDWYCAPPLNLGPLHDAINAWVKVWNEGV